MTQIHKVYLMRPHSGTSGIITFITNEAFGAAAPCKISHVFPKQDQTWEATLLNLAV